MLTSAVEQANTSHQKAKKNTAQKPVVRTAAVPPRQGRSARQESPNVDEPEPEREPELERELEHEPEPEHNESSPETKHRKDVSQKKRRTCYPSNHEPLALNFISPGYAPVTISENESENDIECNMDEDVEDGMGSGWPLVMRPLTASHTEPVQPPPDKGRKRKRAPDSNIDRPSVEADYPAIAPTLPRIQSQGRRVDNRQAVALEHCNSPAVSCHSQDPVSPGASPLHIAVDDDGQDFRRKKAPSRALKALQMAKAEVCLFWHSK